MFVSRNHRHIYLHIIGALGEIVAQPISYVNAIAVADEIGLRVLVNMSEKVNLSIATTY